MFGNLHVDSLGNYNLGVPVVLPILSQQSFHLIIINTHKRTSNRLIIWPIAATILLLLLLNYIKTKQVQINKKYILAAATARNEAWRLPNTTTLDDY